MRTCTAPARVNKIGLLTSDTSLTVKEIEGDGVRAFSLPLSFVYIYRTRASFSVFQLHTSS